MSPATGCGDVRRGPAFSDPGNIYNTRRAKVIALRIDVHVPRR
jgi:hypothetical protein